MNGFSRNVSQSNPIRLTYLSTVLASCILLTCTACDSNGSSRPDLNDPASGQTGTGGVLNGGLSGRIVTVNDFLPMEIDLSTGSSRLLPIQTIQQSLPDVDFGLSTNVGNFTSNVQGSGYVQMIEKCILDEDADTSALYRYDSCLAVFDSNYERRWFVGTPNIQIDGAVKISRSGKYLAFNEFERTTSSGPFSRLYILDVETRSEVEFYGIPMDTSERQSEANESPLAWGPNDTLIYSVPSDERLSIYITNPVSWAPARTVNLPTSYQGEINSLDVSPDGSKVLIGYNPLGSSNGSVLLLNLETLGLTVPIVDARDADSVPLLDEVKGNLLSPRWSPDGRHIMALAVSSGVGPIIDAPTGSATVIPGSDVLYAVPADLSRTVINTDQPTAAIAIAAQRPTGGELTTSFQGDMLFGLPFYDWVP